MLGSNGSVCVTAACQQLATVMLAALAPAAKDPCGNFYQCKLPPPLLESHTLNGVVGDKQLLVAAGLPTILYPSARYKCPVPPWYGNVLPRMSKTS